MATNWHLVHLPERKKLLKEGTYKEVRELKVANVLKAGTIVEIRRYCWDGAYSNFIVVVRKDVKASSRAVILSKKIGMGTFHYSNGGKRLESEDLGFIYTDDLARIV